MSDQLAGLKDQVFEMFGACAAAPDDEALGVRADAVLCELDAALSDATLSEDGRDE